MHSFVTTYDGHLHYVPCALKLTLIVEAAPAFVD